jgi:hypothetical protein
MHLRHSHPGIRSGPSVTVQYACASSPQLPHISEPSAGGDGGRFAPRLSLSLGCAEHARPYSGAAISRIMSSLSARHVGHTMRGASPGCRPRASTIRPPQIAHPNKLTGANRRSASGFRLSISSLIFCGCCELSALLAPIAQFGLSRLGLVAIQPLRAV